MRWGWIVVVWFVVAAVATGAEYFVATDGDDAGSGSAEAPFRTVGRGVAAASSAGDVVTVRAGLYYPRRCVNLVSSGSEGRPVTLRAAAGEEVVLDGRDTAEGSNLVAVLARHVRVEGLTLKNAKNCAVVAWGVGSRVGDVEVIGNTMVGCQRSGFYAGSPSLDDPVTKILAERNTVRLSSLQNAERDGRNGGWSYGLGAGLAKRVVLRDNVVEKCYGEGIGFYLSDDCVAEGNRVADCFAVGIYLDHATRVRVRRNVVYSTGDEGFFRFGKPSNGIQVANENYGGLENLSAANEITHNLLIGNGAAIYYGSYQRGGGLRDTVIAHNTAYGSAGALLAIDADDGHSGTRIENNVFCQLGRRPLTYVPVGSAGLLFRRNLWSGGEPGGGARGEGDVFGDPSFVDPGGFGAGGYRLGENSVGRVDGVVQGAALGENVRDAGRDPEGGGKPGG